MPGAAHIPAPVAMEARLCPWCGAALIQRPDESDWHFRHRKSCNRSHGAKAKRAEHTPLEHRLWRRVDIGGPNECWEWKGAVTKNGYGVIGRGGKRGGNILTHRAALEIHTDEAIPPSREVDHLCHNRLCCNPAHLELVTRSQNNFRGIRTVRNLSERHWQQQVVDLATLYGWEHFHVLDARGSDPGWPDLILCRPPEILAAELKSATGHLRPTQRAWLQRLEMSGVEVAVWRPADFDVVHARLRRKSDHAA